MKPTPKQIEIENEIEALEACKLYAPHHSMFGDDNHAKIDLQIDYFRGEIDTTAGEFDELSDDDQSAIMEAVDWKNGDSKESPSAGWDNYKPKAGK